ncbi:MAG: cytochrome c oxidase subunit 3 [Bacteroidia bacterium]
MDNKIMVKLVVGTEAMFFLCLIMVFVYFSLLPEFKMQQIKNLDISTTSQFTALLLFSSFTYWRAEKNFNNGMIKRFKFWILFTLILGILFLLGQAKEYVKLLSSQVTISSSIFGTSFFTLTGFHGLHVAVGLIIIGIITYLTFIGDYDYKKSSIVSAVGVYWHFVDIVWLFVFFIVYVMPHLS